MCPDRSSDGARLAGGDVRSASSDDQLGEASGVDKIRQALGTAPGAADSCGHATAAADSDRAALAGRRGRLPRQIPLALPRSSTDYSLTAPSNNTAGAGARR